MVSMGKNPISNIDGSILTSARVIERVNACYQIEFHP